MIVGLSGYAQSGKDTAAAQLDGFTRAAFADKLKALAYEMNPLIHDVPLQDIVGARGWESAKRVPEIRQYLQRLGVVQRDVLGPDVWVQALRRTLSGVGSYVITDVRFPNEADALRTTWRLGSSRIIRIMRPGVGPVNGHASESALDGYPFDATVVNDGTPEQLGERIREVIRGA